MVMTTDEIVSMYRQAADKTKQIPILADLNLCKPRDIVAVLRQEGEKIPAAYDPEKNKKYRDKAAGKPSQEQPPELVPEEGMRPEPQPGKAAGPVTPRPEEAAVRTLHDAALRALASLLPEEASEDNVWSFHSQAKGVLTLVKEIDDQLVRRGAEDA